MLFFDFFQVFQYLRTFQLNHLTQMNQWNILHANQPSVPEATPAPGFERMFMPTHRADQLVPTSTAQGNGPKALLILYKRTNFQFRHTRNCWRSLPKAEKMLCLLRNLISFRFVLQLWMAFLTCLTWNTWQTKRTNLIIFSMVPQTLQTVLFSISIWKTVSAWFLVYFSRLIRGTPHSFIMQIWFRNPSYDLHNWHLSTPGYCSLKLVLCGM